MLEFDEEQEIMPGLFDVGAYFNQYSQNIIKGVVPSAQFKQVEQSYKNVVLLVAFAKDFDDLFDSSDKILTYDGDGVCDLKDTLQYKLLITCGTLVKVNKKTRQQVAWIQETRSVLLRPE